MVCGATGAVGGALLRLAAGARWDAVGIYRSNRAGADAAAREWSGTGALRMLACDLTSADEVDALLLQFSEDYCPDALVHLAAPPLEVKALHLARWKDYERQMDGALKAVVQITQPVLRRMMRRKSGRIIAALSAATLGTPPRGFASYTTAKYALAGYMKCLAAEYAERGIVANTVSPGPMDTGLLRELPALMTDRMRESIPGGKWIDPTSVARAIFWLATDASPQITGCNVPLTSGMVV